MDSSSPASPASSASSSSLLDQVLENRDQAIQESASAIFPSGDEDHPHTLQDGSQIYDSTIVAINRILALNPFLHKRRTSSSFLSYALFNGDTPVSLDDKATFLSLLRADWVPRTPFQLTLLKEYVTQYVPEFSLDKFFITKDLIWDCHTATLSAPSQLDSPVSPYPADSANSTTKD